VVTPIPDAETVDPMPGESVFEGDPIPLTQSVQIPAFPTEALSKSIADMVNTISESTQTDLAMAGTSALSALSACTGGHARIEIRPGWRESLNLYTATVARPAERKSAVQYSIVRPIFDVERQLEERSMGEIEEAETRKGIAEREALVLKHSAAKAEGADRDKAIADAIGASMVASSIEVPAVPKIVVDDITPESVAAVLAQQKGRLAMISAEGGIFDIIAGRYSGNVPNLDVWLKGHSGDPIKVDRLGRAPDHIPSPALTLGLMIQPEVLNTIAANRQFRGRGLLARFLYAYPASKVGKRQIPAPPPDQKIIDTYHETITALASGLAGWVGDPAVLMLTETAHEAITAIERAVEPTLVGDGELAPLADWGGKYVGAVARIAGILHLAEHGAGKGPRTAVNAQTILAAHRIGNYFKACAIKAFTEMGADLVTADAIYLLDRIRSLGADEVSERDMHVATKSRFKKKADLLPAVDRLVEHGYLLPIPAALTGERGRPASPRYKVHQ
jgi:hypothetical protein